MQRLRNIGIPDAYPTLHCSEFASNPFDEFDEFGVKTDRIEIRTRILCVFFHKSFLQLFYLISSINSYRAETFENNSLFPLVFLAVKLIN